MSEKTRQRVIVGGVVQGVFFRAATQEMAQRVGVDGWVRNLPDGRVEAVFEGDMEQVAEAVDWTRHGPQRAVVESAEVFAEQPQGLLGFRVMH